MSVTGMDKEKCTKGYLVCGKDAELAASYMFENPNFDHEEDDQPQNVDDLHNNQQGQVHNVPDIDLGNNNASANNQQNSQQQNANNQQNSQQPPEKEEKKKDADDDM